MKLERASHNVELWSNRAGEFSMYGITNGTAVSLTAKTPTQGTKSPLSLQLTSDARPELILEEKPVAHFAGVVLDNTGAPVANASVTVRKGKIYEEEAYGGLFRIAEPLFDQAVVITDAAGKFKTKSTTEFDQDVSITVKAAGFEAYNTGWRELKPSDSDGRQITVGQLRLLREPGKRDRTGEPVPCVVLA